MTWNFFLNFFYVYIHICLLRYWLFSDVVPGLYIEKGWVNESIDYNFTPPPEDEAVDPEEEEDSQQSQGIKMI